MGDEREGDKQYMAPEVLQHVYSKPADIFSLGLIALEIAADIVLPDQGVQWQKLRQGDISDCDFHGASDALVELIRCMIHPDPSARPSIDQVLSHPVITKILEERANGTPPHPGALPFLVRH
jgi:mitosis inhibitor protein kinase SWE1